MEECSGLPDWVGKQFPEFTKEFFEKVRNNYAEETELFCQRTWKLAFEEAKRLLATSTIREPKKNAEDIAQQVSLNALKAVREGRFDPKKPLRGGCSKQPASADAHYVAWIRLITVRKVASLVKDPWHRQRWTPPPTGTEGLEKFPTFTASGVERDELVQKFYDECLNKLGERDRKILKIYITKMDERTINQSVAEALGIGVGGAGAAIHRAMKCLRKLCEKAGIRADWFALPPEPWDSLVDQPVRKRETAKPEEEGDDEDV